jgi:hypothetical protein
MRLGGAIAYQYAEERFRSGPLLTSRCVAVLNAAAFGGSPHADYCECERNGLPYRKILRRSPPLLGAPFGQ